MPVDHRKTEGGAWGGRTPTGSLLIDDDETVDVEKAGRPCKGIQRRPQGCCGFSKLVVGLVVASEQRRLPFPLRNSDWQLSIHKGVYKPIAIGLSRGVREFTCTSHVGDLLFGRRV